MLEALTFLGILHDRDVEWMVANSKRQEIQSGSALIRRGEDVEFLYLIVDGAFDVTVPALKEHRHVARLYAGELVGEMSFVDARPPSATVTARTNSAVLEIARADLDTQLERDKEFAGRFFKGISVLLSNRLRAALSRGLVELDLRVDTADREGKEDKEEMEALARRFEEIRRRVESHSKAQRA